MKKLITFTSILLLCSSLLFAQEANITYLNFKNKKCNKEHAVYYRKVFHDASGLWIVGIYHMNDKLHMFGKYSDKKLKKQQGQAVYYHFNGQISKIGQFHNNKMTGIWKKYYSNGDIQSIGKVVDGKKDSIWTYYLINSEKPFGHKNYINGKAEGESIWFYESGKICEIANYKNDEIISKINYDEEGNAVIISEKDCSAEFIGGNSKYVSFLEQNLKYPVELQVQNMEGVVIFHFIVRKDGKIDKVEFLKSDEPLFNQEALRVFEMIKYMKPARSHGLIIEQECILPINFRLTNK